MKWEGYFFVSKMDVTNCIPGRVYITKINGKYYRLKYLNNYRKKEKVANFVLNSCFKYLFIPSATQRVQENMESRALHIILRRVIGDDSFTWT